MTNHEHHSHSGKHEHGHQHAHAQGRGLHRDWRVWAAVILMLLAMGAYVVTFDEALGPGNNGEQMPAAPAPAAP